MGLRVLVPASRFFSFSFTSPDLGKLEMVASLTLMEKYNVTSLKIILKYLYGGGEGHEIFCQGGYGEVNFITHSFTSFVLLCLIRKSNTI